MAATKGKQPNRGFNTPGSEWNPRLFVSDRVSEMMSRHFGVCPSGTEIEALLQNIEGADAGLELTYAGYERQDELVVSMQALVYWLVNRLLSTPDGIESIVEVDKQDKVSTKSPLYHAALETLRTSKGTLLSAEQVAARLSIDLTDNRKRRLRQLRRLLTKVVADNGGRRRGAGRTSVTFGFV